MLAQHTQRVYSDTRCKLHAHAVVPISSSTQEKYTSMYNVRQQVHANVSAVRYSSGQMIM
jgi:hypothetical protein